MKKFIITAVAATALAVPALASADKPDGTWDLEPKANPPTPARLAMQSSQITQNGQYVSGNSKGLSELDQTTYPGSRADSVQAALGH